MAKCKVGEKPEVLYRVAKFRATPHGKTLPHETVAKLIQISQNLTQIWNQALQERQDAFDTHVAPIYLALKKAKGSDTSDLKKALKVGYGELPTKYDQINSLTPRRQSDPAFASIPRSFQEETLDTLNGSFKSFMALRMNGDFDARPPKARFEDAFSEIPGRNSFAVDGDKFILRCPNFGDGVQLEFPIPKYQQKLFRRAKKVKKFTLYRTPRRLTEEGECWISVAYEIKKPETKASNPHQVAFLQPGASSIGIVSPAGYEVVEFERPDKRLQPQIDALGARIKKCTKGSNGHRRRIKAQHVMYDKRSGQAKLDVREIVKKLIAKHGIHFVVNDIVIRSKKGKLADGAKPERGGSLGLNWGAQNTGSFARFLSHLEEKVKEKGGSVTKYKLVLDEMPPRIGGRVKIWMAQRLKESFLRSIQIGKVA